MKQKTILVAAIAVFVLCLYQNAIFAQENPAIPLKNAFMTELNFKPFGENVISFDQLRFKYKINDDWALRLGLAFDRNSFELKDDDYDSSEPYKAIRNEKITKFGILPGIEYHFLKNSKISPYLGVEFSYFNRSVESHYRYFQIDPTYNPSGRYNYYPVERNINGATCEITIIDNQNQWWVVPMIQYHFEYPERAYTSFGGNLLLGCDFYFMRNLYVGIEAGLGYNHIRTEKVIIETLNEPVTPMFPSYTSSKFGFYYNSALRLGFWF